MQRNMSVHCNQMNLPQTYFLKTQVFRDFTDFGTVEKDAVGFSLILKLLTDFLISTSKLLPDSSFGLYLFMLCYVQRCRLIIFTPREKARKNNKSKKQKKNWVLYWQNLHERRGGRGESWGNPSRKTKTGLRNSMGKRMIRSHHHVLLGTNGIWHLSLPRPWQHCPLLHPHSLPLLPPTLPSATTRVHAGVCV